MRRMRTLSLPPATDTASDASTRQPRAASFSCESVRIAAVSSRAGSGATRIRSCAVAAAQASRVATTGRRFSVGDKGLQVLQDLAAFGVVLLARDHAGIEQLLQAAQPLGGSALCPCRRAGRRLRAAASRRRLRRAALL